MSKDCNYDKGASTVSRGKVSISSFFTVRTEKPWNYVKVKGLFWGY